MKRKLPARKGQITFYRSEQKYFLTSVFCFHPFRSMCYTEATSKSGPSVIKMDLKNIGIPCPKKLFSAKNIRNSYRNTLFL